MKKTKHENLYLKNGIYYYREKGHTRSTYTDKVGLAKKKRDEYRQELLGIKKAKRRTFVDELNDALKVKSAKSEKTYEEALTQDKRLRPFFKKKCRFLDMFERTPERYWHEYCDYMKEQGKKASWHDLKHLIYVLNQAHKNGHIKRKFQRRDFYLEKKEVNRKALSDAEARKLLEVARDKNEKLYYQIKIALYTGMRKSEILGLSVDEINFKKKKITLKASRVKTRRSRVIDIPDDIYMDLKHLTDEAREHGGKYLFPFFNKEYDYNHHQKELSKSTWQRVKLMAGVECKFHDLRRTCATNLMKERYPMTAASRQLGMGIDVLNKIYAQVDEDLSREFREIFKNKFNL